MTMWTRRDMVGRGLLVVGSMAMGNGKDAELRERLRALEARAGGRLGVWMVDTGSGRTAGYKEGERFAMCSTFKMLLTARVLARVDRGEEQLGRQVMIPETWPKMYSPVTTGRRGGTMTVGELCQAAMQISDNEATNLLLSSVGGPAAVTAFCRSLGDGVTRLDRMEPEMSEARLGDVRDTTTPVAVLADWQKIVLGGVLRPESRQRLIAWLVGNQTGDERLRKGLGVRAGWRIGDKTGSSDQTCNDVAVVWPAGRAQGLAPERAPVLVAAFLTECPGTDAARNGVIAEVGRLAGEWIG